MKVIEGNFERVDHKEILDQLHDVMYNVPTLAEAIGLIEIFKLQLYEDQTYND